MHPSLNQPHRPQEEPAVLVAGLQLEFWRGVVVTVHPEWERAAADPWGPDRLDDAINVAVREPAYGIWQRNNVYSVTSHVVPNLLLTSNQKFCFSMRPMN